jgi:hypothetical protein
MGAIQSVRMGDNHEEREGHEAKANGDPFFLRVRSLAIPGRWLTVGRGLGCYSGMGREIG